MLSAFTKSTAERWAFIEGILFTVRALSPGVDKTYQDETPRHYPDNPDNLSDVTVYHSDSLAEMRSPLEQTSHKIGSEPMKNKRVKAIASRCKTLLSCALNYVVIVDIKLCLYRRLLTVL